MKIDLIDTTVYASDGENVGDVERLGDIALALHLAHLQRVAADTVGAGRQALVVADRGCGHISFFRANSMHVHAAVDIDHGTVHITGHRAGQKHDHLSHFRRRSETAAGNR